MIERLLAAHHLQRVAPDSTAADALLAMGDRHIVGAERARDHDPEGAFSLAYDAARKAGTALLAHQGLRPTAAGGHVAVVEAIDAQFPGVPGLRSLDRLRRRRNQGEYPDPMGYDPITHDEVGEAISTARTTVDSVRRLLAVPELGVF